MSLHQIVEFWKDPDCLSAYAHYSTVSLLANSTIFCVYVRELPHIESESDAMRLAYHDVQNLDRTKFIRCLSTPQITYTQKGIIIAIKLIVISAK